LYGSAVRAARDPALFERLGVPDTLDGRFDLLGLHAFLLIDRLRREPPEGTKLAQAVFDAMFSDMDVNLREMGVGDLSVGKKVKQMWEAFHGRCAAYAAALEPDAPVDALEGALLRNVWRGNPAPAAAVAALATLTKAQRSVLAAQPLPALLRGEVQFLAMEEATA
jgi:cytochrome b pre-mRNA-processing protein 3